LKNEKRKEAKKEEKKKKKKKIKQQQSYSIIHSNYSVPRVQLFIFFPFPSFIPSLVYCITKQKYFKLKSGT